MAERVIGIIKDKDKGTITFEDESDSKIKIQVDFPKNAVIKEITKYLKKKREYWIPQSEVTDDYRVDNEIPTKNSMYFKLALCELHSTLGVWVDWSPQGKGG